MSDGAGQTTWVILARGRKVRHCRLSTAIGCGALALTLLTAGGAGLGFGMAEPTVQLIAADNADETDHLIDAYERRIAGLQKQVEQVSARQQSERRAMEAKIAALLERQRLLTERQGQLGHVIRKAATIDPDAVPVPQPRPEPRRAAQLGHLTAETLAAFLPSARERTPSLA